MGALELAVVVEHGQLALPPLAQAEAAFPPPVGQVGRDVDHQRDQHEEEHAAHQGHGQLPAEVRLLLPPAGPQHTEIQHRQPGSGVNTGPLAGRAQAKGNSCQSHGQDALVHTFGQHALAVPEHEISPQQDEEGAVDVDGGNPALGIAHQVQPGQKGRKARPPGRPGEPPHKEIQHRHQSDAEQRPRHAPAEAGHAEHRDAQHDEHLAQRRVGGLVNRHAVQMLVGGAAVVDLVKIHAVFVADGIRHLGLLVEQCPALADHG